MNSKMPENRPNIPKFPKSSNIFLRGESQIASSPSKSLHFKPKQNPCFTSWNYVDADDIQVVIQVVPGGGLYLTIQAELIVANTGSKTGQKGMKLNCNF